MLDGWEEPLGDRLPRGRPARYVDFVEDEIGVPVSLVGTGQAREAIVSLH